MLVAHCCFLECTLAIHAYAKCRFVECSFIKRPCVKCWLMKYSFAKVRLAEPPDINLSNVHLPNLLLSRIAVHDYFCFVCHTTECGIAEWVYSPTINGNCHYIYRCDCWDIIGAESRRLFQPLWYWLKFKMPHVAIWQHPETAISVAVSEDDQFEIGLTCHLCTGSCSFAAFDYVRP